MDAEYAIRKLQLLEEFEVAPEIFQQVMPRLATFMAPFVASFGRQEPFQHAHTYVCGLLSDVERKNIESIAYRFGHIPPNLVVAPRASHNTLDLSMRSPHHAFLRANGI